MEFSKIDSITLKDFVGFRRPNETLDGDNEFAFITTSVDADISGPEISIRALFHPSRSFVYNENVPDRLLLTHELYHFRLCEVSARKTRERLSKLKQVPTKTELNTILDQNRLIEREMQSQYDDETYHGYILKKQKAWQFKVDSLLYSLENFSSTTIRYHDHE